MAKRKLSILPFMEPNFSKHLYYFLGHYAAHAVIYLIVLSVIAFFHFLLNHRLADIQDWIFFHSWWILVFSKSISFFVISRFTRILSFERKPLNYLMLHRKGIVRAEVFICIVIFFIGMSLLGRPQLSQSVEWEISSLFVSYVGVVVFFGLDALLILNLNHELPIARRSWNLEVLLFSMLSLIFNKWIYFYGLNWSGQIFFFYILTLYCLKLRGGFVWLHSFLMLTLLIAPLCILFGLDPLWKDLYSPFSFSVSIGNLEIGVFSLLSLFYFNSKRFKKIPL